MTDTSPTLTPLLSAERIAERVGELADQIASCYTDRPIVLIPVLSGSFMFVADLVRRLPLDMSIEVCGLRSYVGATTRPQHLSWTVPPPGDLAGCDVLIVDDIVDSGATLAAVHDAVSAQQPSSLRTCVLLLREPAAAEPDFVGFRIGPGFVVGYGLDYDGRFRNLPQIARIEAPRAGREPS